MSVLRVSCWPLALILVAASPTWASDSQGQTQDTLRIDPPIHIAPFTLTDQDGQAFSSDKLLGKVWVAHFFYIACNKCNGKTSPAMSDLQELVRGRPDLVLVSISLNQDSPDDLKRYSAGWGAQKGQWIFLTGPKNVVHEIFSKSFYLGLKENPGADPGSIIEHDPKLIVVDRQGNFRGYVNGEEPSAVERLFPRMRQLAGARYVLPTVNAALNFLSGVLLAVGYVAIRRRSIVLHKACMLFALGTSATFLASYLYYHFAVLAGQPPRFPGAGAVWYLYIGILLSHTILAVVVAPLALTVTYLGLRNNLARHVKVARWTLPIWLYVSVTGVVVYWMLYHLYPPY